MSEEKDNIEIYEIGYHLLPTVAEENIPAEAAKVSDIISKYKGNIIGESLPSMRNLAYEIIKKVETKSFKFNKAYFGWIKFEIDRFQTENIKKEVAALPEILRFLIIKTVRENTLYIPKVPTFKKDKPAEKVKTLKQTEASKADIDKSIEELVIN